MLEENSETSRLESAAPPGWQRLYRAVPWILVVGLSVSNALLLRQNVHMRATIGNKKPNIVTTGEKLPSFNAPGLQGEPLGVKYTGSGPKWVLFFFSPACPYSKQQFAYWREIVNRAS